MGMQPTKSGGVQPNMGELISSTRLGGLPSATHDHGLHENEDLGIHRLDPLDERNWSIVWLRYLGRAQQAHIRKWPRLRFPEFLYPPKKGIALTFINQFF